MVNNSLIICSTPLQMMIAEKIIKQSPTHNFDLLVITRNNNSKYQYYYKKLSSLCVNTLYYHAKKNDPLTFILFTRILKKSNLNRKYTSIYLSNIDLRQHQYVISRNQNAIIYTFDDGTANIMLHSGLYQPGKPVKLKSRLFWRFIGIKSFTADIRNKSSLHYTIYKNTPNIIDKTYFIDLLNRDTTDVSQTKKCVRFFLGAPIRELGINVRVSFIENILNKLKIDYYFPHPREDLQSLKNARIIKSNYIFEDFLVDYLHKNPEEEVIIYSFTSSAALNISNLNRVSVYLVKNPFQEDKLKNFYHFVENNLDIPVISL